MHVLLLAVFCIFIAAASWFYLHWRLVKQYWKVRGVPYLPPNPFLGSLTFLQKENIGVWMRKLKQQFKSPYVGIWWFWRPALVINSPDLARNILIKDTWNFRDRFIQSGENDPIGAYSLFMMDEPLYTNVRKRIMPVFTTSKINTLQDLIQSKAKDLIQRIQNEKNNRISLRNMFADFATDVVGVSIFGVTTNATLTGESPLRVVTDGFMNFNTMRAIAWCCIFFWPDMAQFFGFTVFPKSATDYLRKFVQKMISQREVNDGKAKDLLDALITIKKESAEDGEEYSEDFIMSQASTFLQGGYDTMSGSLTFITYELAHHPELQEQFYQELLKAKEKHGSDNFTFSFLSELMLLNCIVKEGLRKYPTLGWLDRVCINEYKVDDELTIEAGTPVYVNAIGMHYDPEYFPEPTKFDPSRFLPQNLDKIKPYTYMPFGEGTKLCIGKRLGQMSLKYALAAIFLNYQAVPYEHSPKPNDIKIQNKGLFYSPGQELSVKFIRRI